MTKKIIALLCLSILFIGYIVAEDDDYEGVTAYSRGEQIFSLNGGAIFPIGNFVLFPQGDETATAALSSTNIGIAGSLKWGAFVIDNLLLGAEINGMLATTYNRTLTMVPISFAASYYFIYYPFEFPVYLNVGFSLNKLNDLFRVSAFIKPGFGVFWKFNEDWAFGLKTNWWILPEIYFQEEYSNQSRIANFIDLSLSAVYHF